MDDRNKKGRQSKGDKARKGIRRHAESHHNTTLTTNQITAIREAAQTGIKHTVLANQYETTPRTIGRIVARLTWKHV